MASRRLVALDVLRGAAVAAMIVVNNPGNWLAVYPQLQHAAWNGCTFADLVFPFFIVILGVALPFAFDRRRSRTRGTGIVRRIVTRCIVLVGLGLVLNAVAAWPHLATMRFPGVLQRIALTYAVAAIVVWRCAPRTQFVVVIALLLAHWALVVLGITIDLDRAVFGRHMLTADRDPEGLIGTMTSIATALLGALAGAWILRTRHAARAPFSGLVGGGIAVAAIGWGWSLVLPMNKSLWTGSYALFVAGLAIVTLAAAMVIVERTGERWIRPFEWLGTNALMLYFGSELLARLLDRPLLHRQASVFSIKEVIFWRWLAPLVHDTGGARSSLLFGLIYATLWLAVAAMLPRATMRPGPSA